MNNVRQLVQDIQSVQVGTKVDYDGFMTRHIFRPCSYYYAAFLYKYFKFTPNEISILSGALGIISIVFAWFFPSLIVLFFILFSIACLDNSDGALARYLNKSGPIGALADAFGGYLIVFSMPILTWVMLVVDKNNITALEYSIGIFTLLIVAFEFLGRAMKFKLDNALLEVSGVQDIKNTAPSKIARLQGNLSFCGFMFPIFMIFWIVDMPLVSLLYSLGVSFITGLIGFGATAKRILSK